MNTIQPSANKEVFEAYFDYLCWLATNLPNLTERQDFANRAVVALAFFSENAQLDETLVQDIQSYQDHLAETVEMINTAMSEKAESAQKKEDEAYEESFNQAVKRNGECITSIYKCKDMLQRASSQEQFDKHLKEIGLSDSTINKEILTEEQATSYEELTKALTELISVKMREFEFAKNVEYNKKAAEAFNRAFGQFREDEGKYKNQTQLYALASNTLFAFDASRLFNETLIFYNHVYSYIFSKLDDDGKFALTRYSIECERKLR